MKANRQRIKDMYDIREAYSKKYVKNPFDYVSKQKTITPSIYVLSSDFEDKDVIVDAISQFIA